MKDDKLQGLLSTCLAKINASEEHLNRFNEATDRFFEEKTHVAPIAGEPNNDRTKYLFKVQDVIEWPAVEFAIMIGDSVHCLRSALDQLVYGFARNPSERTAFPICKTERDWIVEAPARYWSVPEFFVELLDQVQPYHQADKAAQHPLAILQTLSNLDKHRSIPVLALVPDNSRCEVIRTEGIASMSKVRFKKGAIYERDAVIAWASIVPDDSGVEPEIQVNVTQTYNVGFGDIPGASWLRRRPVFDTFDAEIAQPIVNDVFKPLVDAWNKTVEALEQKARSEGGPAQGDLPPAMG